jgi:toxin ParE1/3/4
LSLRVVQTPESLADIALEAEYYFERGGLSLASRFVDAVKASIRLLAQHPGIGKETAFANSRLEGLRYFLVGKPFEKTLIFYRVSGDSVDVTRIMHGYRDLPRRLLQQPGSN